MQRSQMGNLHAIKRKGSNLLGGVMGGLASGGSAKANPEYANLSKYGELGNVAGDSNTQPFVKSGFNLFGQSDRAAEVLNNQVAMSGILAQQQDAMQRAMLPFQTNEGVRGAVDTARQTGAMADERATNARQQGRIESGEQIYQGLTGLTDKEKQLLYPNNPDVDFMSFEKLKGLTDSMYPQVGNQGFKGILAGIPQQNAAMDFNTSPEGKIALTDKAKYIASKEKLDAQNAATQRIGDTIAIPDEALNPKSYTEIRSGSNKTLNKQVPIPFTSAEQKMIADGVPIQQKYMRQQETFPLPPSYRKVNIATQEELNGVTGVKYPTSGVGMGNVRASAADGIASEQQTLTASGVSTPFSQNPPTGKADQPPAPQVMAQQPAQYPLNPFDEVKNSILAEQRNPQIPMGAGPTSSNLYSTLAQQLKLQPEQIGSSTLSVSPHDQVKKQWNTPEFNKTVDAIPEDEQMKMMLKILADAKRAKESRTKRGGIQP